MHDGVSTRMLGGATIVAAAVILATLAPASRARADAPAAAAMPPAPPEVARDAGVRAASARYAMLFNERNYDKLAEEWTERAELVEGEGTLLGRSAIMRSIRAWLDRHPQAQLAIEVTRVEFPADSLARVSGRMTFTSRAGAKPVESRFVSLRVLENGRWRLAESVVMPSQSAALDELEWLVGTWQNDAERAGFAAEATFSRPLGDACIVGRTTIKPKQGKNREILQIIHPDRASGLVRTWIFDSTGARAEGVVESDGTSYHQSLVGTPAESARGSVARWVQVIAPTGEGRFTVHAIERSVDGVPLPDGQPMDFRKVR